MKNVSRIILIASLISLGGCLDSPEPPPTFEEQLSADLKIIDAYLEENEIETDIHESGIRYIVKEEGDGLSPERTDSVKVKYKGQLLNGTVFDENAEGITFPLNFFIAAWQIMIPEMKEGGKMTIYAPSVYCYGNRPNGSIPANSNLIFEVELLEVKSQISAE